MNKSSRTSIQIISLLLLSLSGIACSNSSKETGPATTLPKGNAMSELEKSWHLEQWLNPDGSSKNLAPSAALTLRLQAGTMSGHSGCNHYSGNYHAQGQQLHLNATVSTMMACADSLRMQQEHEYLQRLGQVAAYRIVNGKLQLLDAQQKPVFIFAAVTQASLTGGTWKLSFFNAAAATGDQTVTTGPDNETSAGYEKITLAFDNTSRLSGFSGCNRYMASYSTSGQNLAIGNIGSTRMACQQAGVMQMEQQYLALLKQTASYQIQDSNLTLFDANKNTIAGFTQQP